MIAPLRILFFSTVHPHHWSPTKGAFNATMLRGLVAAGAEVRAIVPVPWTERRGMPTQPEASYPVDYVPFRYVPRIAPLALAAQLSWCCRKQLDDAARHADLILGYWIDPDGTVASRAAKRNSLPYVQMVGGSDLLMLATNPARGRRIRETLGAASRVIAIGRNLHDALVERGVAPEIVREYHRGVDRSRFAPGNRDEARATLGLPLDRPVLLWVGRMVAVKGLEVLIEAMAHSQLRAEDPLLVLVGDGPLRGSLEQLASILLPAGAVRFAGNVPHARLATWYQAADLMVLPSRSEGIPNVLLEALACGTGFVASDVGSVRELATSPDHQLVPPGDSVALATGLTYQLASPTRNELAVPDSADSARRLIGLLRELLG